MQRERIELFRNHAQFVGPSCMIPDPGDYFAFDDTGVPILIVRNAEGELNAFLNICSHRGAPLNECDHGKEGFAGIDRDALGLQPLQVEEKHGFIFVMPNPELRFDIDEVLGGLDERLSGFGPQASHYLGAKQVLTDFSWKLNMDTFQEFYHFEFLHPESIGQMAYSNVTAFHQYGRNHSIGSATLQINALKAIPEDQ